MSFSVFETLMTRHLESSFMTKNFFSSSFGTQYPRRRTFDIKYSCIRMHMLGVYALLSYLNWYSRANNQLYISSADTLMNVQKAEAMKKSVSKQYL